MKRLICMKFRRFRNQFIKHTCIKKMSKRYQLFPLSFLTSKSLEKA